MIASFITTHDRPAALARTLPQVVALGDPVLVIDDASTEWELNRDLCRDHGVAYLRIPVNRGLAGTMNIAFSFYFADARVNFISYFQDDVDVHPRCHQVLRRLINHAPLYSGHDAAEHPAMRRGTLHGYQVAFKQAIRATHMFAPTSFWRRVFPIPTNQLGTPKPVADPTKRGTGSNADWWVVRDAPKSIQKQREQIIVVPGLVRTFCWKAEDSCWNNPQRGGEDRPLGEF